MMATLDDVRAEIARRELARRQAERAARPLGDLTPEEGDDAMSMVDSGVPSEDIPRRIRLERKQSAAVADVPDPDLSRGEAVAIGLGNGATGGNLPGLAAALGHGEGENFAERRADNVNDLEQVRRQRPNASYAGEVGGYAAPAAGGVVANAAERGLASIGAGGLARAFGGTATKAAAPSIIAQAATREGLRKLVGAGATTGGIYGALQGAMSTETGTPGDIAWETAKGTGIGAVGGAVLGLLPRGASSVAASPIFQKLAHAVATPFEAMGKNADELRALTTMGSTGGSINAPAVLREAERMPGGVPAFAENLRKSGISKGITTTSGIAKRAGAVLESSGKNIGQIIDEASDKGGMVDVDALVARLRHEAALASKGFEGVSSVSSQHTRHLERIADSIEQRVPPGGMVPIQEMKALGVSLGEDAEQAYRAQAMGRPVKGSGLALMDTRRSIEGGVGDAISSTGMDLDQYAAAKRDNQTARIAQEAADTSRGRAHKNNLIGLTTATIAQSNPIAGVLHHVIKPIGSSLRATGAEASRDFARFLKQTPKAIAGRAPMQAGNAAFAPRFRNTEPSTHYNLLEDEMANGWPTADDLRDFESLRSADHDAEASAAMSSVDEDEPSMSMLGEMGGGTFKKPPPKPPPSSASTHYNLLEDEMANGWPTADDINSHHAMANGDALQGEIDKDADAFNGVDREPPRDDEVDAYNREHADESRKLQPIDQVKRRHAREDALPPNKADALQEILLASNVHDNDSARASAAYAAGGKTKLHEKNGMLDAFDSKVDAKKGKGPKSLLEAFVRDIRMKKIKTWRQIVDSGILDKLADALGLPEGQSLRIPQDYIDRHVAQDAELKDIE